ncbi:MAG: hypothetical protein DWQ31_16115 [Planctomycetota bacterium]|nr:MAG: hypothetical protein DWQ31_16115 [Planctomycetota bacterium]REJ89109.1 MAG: hypothetical protein DWQ35_18790 [Planctomycetota bacterium]REK24667.1 MAG: hypothetical protein DWQ42_13130 [Planctomycetota bacterium]REK40166.1 MAG: hypothetical protein DWQ46_17055 [Planctomycetota bacterium]
MRAKIHWKTADEGGRSKPPAPAEWWETPYNPAIRLHDPTEPWPSQEVTWTVFVRQLAAGSSEREWIADVRYAMPEAPRHELRAGRRFELYEGPHCVATGVLLEE